MYVRTHVSMYVCNYVCMYVCMHVCMFVCYSCMHVGMYVCMYVCFRRTDIYSCSFILLHCPCRGEAQRSACSADNMIPRLWHDEAGSFF